MYVHTAKGKKTYYCPVTCQAAVPSVYMSGAALSQPPLTWPPASCNV